MKYLFPDIFCNLLQVMYQFLHPWYIVHYICTKKLEFGGLTKSVFSSAIILSPYFNSFFNSLINSSLFLNDALSISSSSVVVWVTSSSFTNGFLMSRFQPLSAIFSTGTRQDCSPSARLFHHARSDANSLF